MKEIKETALILVNEMHKAKEITSDTDVNQVFFSAETIISCLSFLIGPVAEMEQKYRLKIVESLEKGDSHNKAEALAKASDEYKEWRKYSNLCDLGHEQVMLLKKFREDLKKEYQRI